MNSEVDFKYYRKAIPRTFLLIAFSFWVYLWFKQPKTFSDVVVIGIILIIYNLFLFIEYYFTYIAISPDRLIVRGLFSKVDISIFDISSIEVKRDPYTNHRDLFFRFLIFAYQNKVLLTLKNGKVERFFLYDNNSNEFMKDLEEKTRLKYSLQRTF